MIKCRVATPRSWILCLVFGVSWMIATARGSIGSTTPFVRKKISQRNGRIILVERMHFIIGWKCLNRTLVQLSSFPDIPSIAESMNPLFGDLIVKKPGLSALGWTMIGVQQAGSLHMASGYWSARGNRHTTQEKHLVW